MTVRTLVLLRHAKAAHPDGLSDRERPLTARGHADAAAAGAWLAKQGLLPDLVLCSPARRTRETWNGVRVALGTDPRVQVEPGLYDMGTEGALALLGTLGPDVATVLLVGHNPTVSTLSAALGGGGGDGFDDALRTGGIAVHQLSGPWSEISTGRARLTATHTARA